MSHPILKSGFILHNFTAFYSTLFVTKKGLDFSHVTDKVLCSYREAGKESFMLSFIKENNRLVEVFIIILLLFSPCLSQAHWKKATLPIHGFDLTYNSIALDSSGNPHITYVNTAGLIHAYFNGKGWLSDIVDPTSIFGGSYSAMVIDKLDHIHVAYDGNEGMRYAYFDGSTWNITSLAFGGGAISIALDNNNYPHISYVDFRDLKHTYYDGSIWSTDTISNSVLSNFGTSIAVSPMGKVYISYSDRTTSTRQDLYLATNASGSWKLEQIGEGLYSSMALDSLGNPHLVYLDGTTYQTWYQRFNGSSWTLEQLTNDQYYSEMPVLILDSQDHPHVAFKFWIHDNDYLHPRLTYAYFDGANWASELIDSISAFSIPIAITLDRLGLPHLVYSQSIQARSQESRIRYSHFVMPELSGTWSSIVTTSVRSKFVTKALLDLNNTGTEKSGSFSVSCYLSEDGMYDDTDVFIGKKTSQLNPGKPKTITFTYKSSQAPSGKYVIAVIDSGGKVNEVDENNNIVIEQVP
jgi:hypothetical protein